MVMLEMYDPEQWRYIGRLYENNKVVNDNE